MFFLVPEEDIRKRDAETTFKLKGLMQKLKVKTAAEKGSLLLYLLMARVPVSTTPL